MLKRTLTSYHEYEPMNNTDENTKQNTSPTYHSICLLVRAQLSRGVRSSHCCGKSWILQLISSIQCSAKSDKNVVNLSLDSISQPSGAAVRVIINRLQNGMMNVINVINIKRQNL